MPIYIIDAYNLLFRFLKERSNLEAERREFVSKLNEIATLLKLEVTLVFDGHFSDEGYTRTHTNSLEIIYTEKGESADSAILSELELRPHPSRVTVVTSDRDLTFKVKRMGAKVETSKTFYKRLLQQAQKKKSSKKKAIPQKEKRMLSEYEEYLLKIFEERLEEE